MVCQGAGKPVSAFALTLHSWHSIRPTFRETEWTNEQTLDIHFVYIFSWQNLRQL